MATTIINNFISPRTPFEMVIKTDNLSAGSTADNQFRIPHYSNGTYNYRVDWGDGTVENIVGNTSPTHTYASIGTYTVKIWGIFAGITFANTGDRLKLLEISKWGMTKWNTLNWALFGCSNLVITAPDFGYSSNVLDFELAFRSCTSMTTIPAFDAKSATSFSQIAYGCTSLTSFPLVNTSNVVNMVNAFFGCSSLTTLPLLDTSAVTDFDFMCASCSGLSSFPLINTSNGLSFVATWANCTSLTSFPLLDFSKATDVSAAWVNTRFTSFPALDMSSVSNFTQAWRGSINLVSFPLLNIVNATTFASTGAGGAWGGCNSLQHFSANFFDNWTASPAFNCFVDTWAGCKALTAQSVENILVSIDTSGRNAPAGATGTQADIAIDYNVATGALTGATNTAITNLKAKGWKPYINNVYV